MEPKVEQAMIERIREHGRRLERTVGYNLPAGQDAVFERARQWLSSDSPSVQLLKLRGKPSHHRRLQDGAWLQGNVHRALIRAQYHRDRVLHIEEELHRSIDPMLVASIKIMDGSAALGGGNTLQLDFEYQGFIMSVRTALDYLARTINAYFCNEGTSFRDLPDALQKGRPREIADSLLATLRPLHKSLAHFCKKPKSVRDVIAHDEFVTAGHLQITLQGVFLFGGGEGMKGPTERLITVVDGHLDLLVRTVTACLTALINSDEQLGSSP